MLKLSSKQ